LHRLIAYQQYEQVLELGTSLGLSTCYLALYPEVKVTTIEGSKEVWQQAQQTFKMAGVSNQITSHCGTFDKALPQILLEKPCYDLIFIDGNHSYEATLRYVKQLRPYLSKNGLMVLDDIYWSKGMTQAWEELKPSFNVSIDLFFIGILSQRTEQAKEDFKLRVW
jgi:predicted O-methyltransferase YrrM